MAITEAFSGSEAISTTEHSLTTDTAGPDTETSDGEFQIFLDLSDMVAGDELQIRVYEKVLSGSTQRIVYQSNLVGAQAQPVWVSPKLMLMHGWDVTLDAISGTISVDWSIRKIDPASSAELATVSSKIDTVDDLIDTEVAAIKTVSDAIKLKTDSLTFTVAGQVDANIQYVNDVQVTGTGAEGDEWGP